MYRPCSNTRCWRKHEIRLGEKKNCIDYTVQIVMLSSSLQMRLTIRLQLDIQHSQVHGEDEKGKTCSVLPGMKQAYKL
jgi:hypothetical protein